MHNDHHNLSNETIQAQTLTHLIQEQDRSQEHPLSLFPPIGRIPHQRPESPLVHNSSLLAPVGRHQEAASEFDFEEPPSEIIQSGIPRRLLLEASVIKKPGSIAGGEEAGCPQPIENDYETMSQSTANQALGSGIAGLGTPRGKKSRNKTNKIASENDSRQDIKLTETDNSSHQFNRSESGSSLKQLVAAEKNQYFSEQEIQRQQKFWPNFITTVTYLISETHKKQRSFQIGVFTVFIVVAFLTLLKSIVDVSAVAFVKVAQDQAGMSDFRMLPNFDDPLETGNRNFFTENLQFSHDSPSGPSFTGGLIQTASTIGSSIVTADDQESDHITLFGGLNILNFDYFDRKLQNLQGFEGFTPRWTLITRLRNTTNPRVNSSALFLIIDSKREVDIGLGRYFSQTILGDNDIMVSNAALRHLGINPYKKQKIEIFFSLEMIQQILGPLEAAGGANLQEQLNQFLGTGLGPGGSNITISDILATGRLSKPLVYRIINAFGFNFTEQSRIKIDIQPQLNQLYDLIGNTTYNLNPNQTLNIPASLIIPQLNFSLQNLTGGSATSPQQLLLSLLNLGNFTISGANLNLSSSSIANETLLPLLSQLQNVTLSGGNFNFNLTQLLQQTNSTIAINPVDLLKSAIALSNQIARGNISDGTTIEVPIDPIIEALLVQGSIPTSIGLEYTVVEGFDDPKGKFPNTLGNVAVVDCHSVGFRLKAQLQQIINNIGNGLTGLPRQGFEQVLPQIYQQLENMGDIDMCKYALQIEGLLKKPTDYYTISNDDQMEEAVVKKGLKIIERVSLNSNVTITAPLVTAVETIGFLRVFLESAMGTIVFFLGILSVQLIYSLMVSDVDEKTYQYGMLRALGFRQKSLITLISLQSFFFSIPGLCGGLIVASFLNLIVRFFIFQYSRNSSTYDLSEGSIWLGAAMGLILPLLANIIPIQNALSKNLRVSLDLYHRTVSQLTVSMKRLENMGMSVTQLVLAIMLVFMGILTYYFAPLSFLYRNYSLFFMIMNLVLIFMILGLAFLSLIFLPTLQKLLVKLFVNVYPKDKILDSIIQKNLLTHQQRNTKTAIMFVIALSFLIFAGSVFELIGRLIVTQLEMGMGGADLYANSAFSKVSYLDEAQLIQFLNEQKAYDGAVDSYTFASTEMTDLLKTIAPANTYQQKIYFGVGCGYSQVPVRFHAINQNYLDTVDTKKYFIPNEIQGDKSKYEIVQMLYQRTSETDTKEQPKLDKYAVMSHSKPGNDEESRLINAPDIVNVLIAEGFRDAMSLDTSTTARICVNYVGDGEDNCDFPYKTSIKAMLTKVPGFFFMSYRQIIYSSSILTSTNAYKKLMQDILDGQTDSRMKDNLNELLRSYNFTDAIPKEYLFVRLKPGTHKYRREYIANGIRSFQRDDLCVTFDIEDLRATMQSSLSLFDLFSIVVGTIALILAFFLLLTSTNANIRDNFWELGVLKAMGLNRAQTTRMLLYEALSTVLAALILGLAIGLIVAFTLTAQFYLFIELPIVLSFPIMLFLIMMGISLVTTFLAVLIPVWVDLNSKEIATIIKASA